MTAGTPTPTPTRPGLSVCFPAFNEEATVGAVIEEADQLLAASGLDYEILACDDGSKDATGAVMDELATRLKRLRVLHHPLNLGIRATFEHLYAEAAKDLVFLNSADRQWPTRIVLDMLPLASDWDIVIARRREKHYGWQRAVVSWGFNAIPPLLFGIKTYDAGAVKLVRREVLSRFTLVSRSPFSEAERLIRAARAGYRIREFPVDVEPRRSGLAGGAKPRLVAEALADVVRVWWDLARRTAG